MSEADRQSTSPFQLTAAIPVTKEAIDEELQSLEAFGKATFKDFAPLSKYERAIVDMYIRFKTGTFPTKRLAASTGLEPAHILV